MFKTILSNFHLEKIFWIIKTKLLYMIMAAAIMAAGVGAYASLTSSSTYLAEISFYAYSNPDYIDTDISQSAGEVTQAKNLLESYMQIIASDNFLNKVIDSLDYDVTTSYLRARIGASAVGNTAVFVVDVYNEDPLFAMEVANAIGELAPAEVIRIVKAGGIEILDEAKLPTTPYASTNVIKLSIIGGALGFILSCMFFMIKGLLDTTIRRKYEIEDLFTIPILGSVPNMEPAKKGEKVDTLLNDDSPFAVKEAYRDIRAGIVYVAKGKKCPVFAITSADMHEGKTLSALNIANSFARIGKKVLVIDADMRKSYIEKILGIKNENKNGLSKYLAAITEELFVVHQNDNFDIIPAGEYPPNPAELLVSDRWKELLMASKEIYDMIFIDLPPAGIVSDALAVVNDVNSYILVVREKVTKFDREEMIVRKLEAIGANISGFIYNAISIKSPDYNYKEYGKDYKY